MKAYSLWIRRCITLTMILVMVLALFNMVVDPNGVFDLVRVNGFNARKTSRLSDRITKFYYARRYKPDSLIMGTSRAAFIDPRDLEKYTHGRAFNLALYGSGIKEQYAYFKYMVESFGIKTLLLGVDFVAFSEDAPGSRRIQLATHFREERLNNRIYLKDYTDSLFNLTALRTSYETIKENRDPFDIVQDDRTGYREWKKEDYEKNQEERFNFAGRSRMTLQQHARLYSGMKNYSKPIRQNMTYLKMIVDLAQKHHVRCKFYESPVHGELFDLLYASGIGGVYEDWKRQVAEITDFTDFEGHNEITDRDLWWGDPSHAVTEAGALMLARLYNDPHVKVPDDFGVAVTRQNVEERIRTLRSMVRPVDLKKILEGK